MENKHGMGSSESATKMPDPEKVESAVAVIWGTAPVNYAESPKDSVNKPITCWNIDDAKQKLGYNSDFKNFTLCQSMYVRLESQKAAPVIFINVLDPEIHKKDIPAEEKTVQNNKIVMESKRVLLDSIAVSDISGDTTYVKGEDYLTSFGDDGTAIIAVLSSGKIKGTVVKVAYSEVAPEMVTKNDIIGGYDTSTGKRTGLSCIASVYRETGLIPSILLAPGYSHIPEVAAVMSMKTKKINGLFNAIAVCDIDTSACKTIEAIEEWKNENGYNTGEILAVYPKAKLVDGTQVYLSALADGALAASDIANDGPFEGITNKEIEIASLCLEDGTEVCYEVDDANKIESAGIVTAINMQGWRMWGDYMSCWPENSDIKDAYIVERRVFNYDNAVWKSRFFTRIGEKLTRVKIEDIVQKHNDWLKSLAKEEKIAGGEVTFDMSKNTTSMIIAGHVLFDKKLAAYVPTRYIETEEELDIEIIKNAIGL